MLEQYLFVILTEHRRRNDFRCVSTTYALSHKILDNNRRPTCARVHIGNYMQYSHYKLRMWMASLKACLSRWRELHVAVTGGATIISRKAKAQESAAYTEPLSVNCA